MNRRMKAIHYSVISMLFILLFSGSIAVAKDDGTVVLKSGTRYENITYSVDRFYKVVKFEYEGREKNVSFIDIEAIYDLEGNDVTDEKLGTRSGPRDETWLSEESDKVKTARAKDWNGMLRLGANYSIPSGDYYEGIKAGIGFEGSVHFAINRQVAVQALISRSGMKVDDNFRLYLIDPDYSLIDQHYSISTIRYLLGAEYYQPLKWNDERSFWYLFSGLGAAVHKIKSRATMRYNPTGELAYLNDTSNQSKFVISLGFGVVKAMSKKVGLSFDGSMDLVHVGSVESRNGREVVYAYIFDLKLGLIAFF